MVLARFHPAQPLAGSWCLLSACRLPLQEMCPSQNGLSPELGLVPGCSLTEPSMGNLLFEDIVPMAERLVLSMLSPCSLTPIRSTELACARGVQGSAPAYLAPGTQTLGCATSGAPSESAVAGNIPEVLGFVEVSAQPQITEASAAVLAAKMPLCGAARRWEPS